MTSINLPQPAEGVSAATVRRWLKQSGESFKAGDPLVELEGENAFIVVEADRAGRLVELLVEPGETVRIGEELARIELDIAAPPDGRTDQSAERIVSADRPTGGKVIPILMPQAGNTMEEGSVVAWRVKVGDTIAVGQIICEIETDKATMEFESPDAGRLARIVAPVGEPIAVKQPIALLADSEADVIAFLAGDSSSSKSVVESNSRLTASTPSQTDEVRLVSTTSVSADGRVKASPAARRIAAERGIPLARVGTGSGPLGRILSSDLNGIAIDGSASASAGEVRRPLSKMRRAIGLNLQQSKQTVPHFYVRLTIDADPLLAYYREQKSSAACTLNDVIVLAVGRAIREFPAVRSQVVGNEIIEYPHVNIGIAVGVDEGLVVPVVLAVDTLSLAQLAAETKRVVDNSRKGKLENIGKGHFTISNLGMFGVDEFSAIINPPESGILAVGAAKETVVVENGAMRAGRTMTMTLSSDHRIVDGVMAAKFMARLKEILENPSRGLA